MYGPGGATGTPSPAFSSCRAPAAYQSSDAQMLRNLPFLSVCKACKRSQASGVAQHARKVQMWCYVRSLKTCLGPDLKKRVPRRGHNSMHFLTFKIKLQPLEAPEATGCNIEKASSAFRSSMEDHVLARIVGAADFVFHRPEASIISGKPR